MFWLYPAMAGRKADELLMQLRITTNPHLEEKDARPFVEELLSMARRYGDYEERESRAFDRQKVEQLRSMLKTPHIRGANSRK